MSMYDVLNYVGAAALIGYNFFCMKERRERTASRIRRWILVETLVLSVLQYLPALLYNKLFGALVGTGANYFGLMFLSPVCIYMGCKLMKTDPLIQMDLVTPAYPLALFFSKIGCFFGGCCTGFPWEMGLVNPQTGNREFPAQLLEAAVALGVFLVLQKIRKRLKRGTVFPLYFMLYSGSRFFTEFLRGERQVFLGLKTYQLLCLLGVVIGAMEYYLAVTDPKYTE